jgi:signal transduction histidine kinase
MKKIAILIIFVAIVSPLFGQLNITDTFKTVMHRICPDSVKIDELNDDIYKYAPTQPGLVLLYSDSAILLSQKINDSIRIANSISRKGVALYFLGDYNGSLDQYFNAVKIKEKSGHTNTLWREYNNIGLVLKNQNQNEEALKYFDLAMNQLQPNEKKSIASVWNNIGISYKGLKKYDFAKKAIEKALEINIEIGEKQSIAFNYNNLGNIYFFQKNYTLAIDYYEKALKINVELYNRYEEAQNLNNLANTYIELKEFKKANDYLEKAGKIIIEIKSEVLYLEYLNNKTDYYTATKDFEKAFQANRKYSIILDSLFYSNKTKQYDQLKTILNIEKEVQKIEFLERINSIQQERIKIQHFVEKTGGIVLLTILLLLFILMRNLKIRKRLNLSLIEKSHEMSSLNEELKSANDELRVQHEELETTLDSLKLTQDKLIQSEKMASMGILSAGVAHEINNPLNFIQGGVLGIENLLNTKLKEDLPEIYSYLNAIQEGVKRAADIVSKLNQYSQQDNLPFESCNIHSIIDHCLSMLISDSDKGIKIEKIYFKPVCLIECNESKIHRAISNILVNAVQSLNGSGKITISSDIEKDSLILTIKDTGYGISKEDLPKIFDPFFTTKDPGKGTGLGLSTTFNIINEHRGSVIVDSEFGIGTTVKIVLPVFKG